MNGGGGIVPMLKNSKEDYLPEEFTIEFDAYFNEDHGGSYHIYLLDYKNQRNLDKTFPLGKKYIRIYKNSADGSDIEQNYYPGYKSSMFDKSPKWRHVAISFNKRALKVYLDDARVLNIPNLGYNPTGFSFGKQTVDGKDPGYTKNIRIAKGAVPLYDKFLTDGKFVTTDIKFESNLNFDKNRLSDEMKISCYRIVSELMNNSMKHAAATEVMVQLIKEESRLGVMVEDNGKGFDTATLNHNKGAGLTSIRSRVDYLKGQLDIHSEPGKGTLVNIEFNI